MGNQQPSSEQEKVHRLSDVCTSSGGYPYKDNDIVGTSVKAGESLFILYWIIKIGHETNWIYQDVNIYLQRKYNLYNYYLNCCVS